MILCISTGSFAPIARSMAQDGVPITLFVCDPSLRDAGFFAGLCPQVQTLEEGLQCRPDAVLFDGSRAGALATELAKTVPVWGASTLADAMEYDRGPALEVMSTHGIRIPDTLAFDPVRGKQRVPVPGAPYQTIRGHAREACAIASELDGRWVIKPYEGVSAETYLAKTRDDLIDRIKDLPNTIGETPFLLQKYIKGVEISTEVWVQYGEMVPQSVNATLETKKFYPGDLGPNTGSETSLLWGYGPVFPKIFRSTFGTPAFQEWLRHPVLGGVPYPPYHGPLDLNCIVSEDDHQPYALEWTPRMGWVAYYALMELLPKGKQLADLFHGVARGGLGCLPVAQRYAYVIKASIPPYPVAEMLTDSPHSVDTLGTGHDVSGPVSSPHVWLGDVRLRNGNLETTGGEVAFCSGSGATVEEARDSAHLLFEDLCVANKQGRVIDGADRFLHDLGVLAAWGYETPDR